MRILALFFLSSLVVLAADPVKLGGAFRATAYAQSGITKSGELTHRHVVAADPDVLPIGTRIKIRRAGRYSGEYVVADTGSKVAGRHLDIYMPSERACKRFGTKMVKVKVLQLGDGSRDAVKESDKVVKEHVAKDLENKAVGSSATQDDWSRSKAAKNAAEEAKSVTAPATATSAAEPPANN